MSRKNAHHHGEAASESDADSAAGVQRVRERLRAIRQLRGLTQQQVADRCGLTRTAVTDLESGRRRDISLGQALIIASALDVDLGRLLDPEPLDIVLARVQ
ncbi:MULTISPECIES: helix-turn-helix transcriptional regulator [Frankia]|uniref:Transcriptional regulator n=1 Tax=Frankia alni (strain DSM 45986 / CECT 9034 / ACN14a) TaxID=326424 RepID=Q0RM68_FRAAA|nr:MULTISPECIES: helix-turn-helix transcriptional regulator [Frankia]CAJ61384.1 Putative transcriptional regulator [Frankia alni ACN14a]